MVKAGYSLTTSKRTNKLTRTKGWEEMIEKYISEEALLKVHKEGLQATKSSGVGGMTIGLKGSGEVESMGHSDMMVPDYAVRHKYLETGYKVRGRLKEKDITPTQNNFFFIDEQQQQRIAERLARRNTASDQPSETEPS